MVAFSRSSAGAARPALGTCRNGIQKIGTGLSIWYRKGLLAVADGGLLVTVAATAASRALPDRGSPSALSVVPSIAHTMLAIWSSAKRVSSRVGPSWRNLAAAGGKIE